MFSSNTSQVSNDVNYIEDVFSTHLYTGNGSTQTITNGIDLAGKGGLVWLKSRSTANSSHVLIDSARGSRQILSSNTTANQVTAAVSEGITAFNANGFSLGTNVSSDIPTNTSAATYASWTFRKQPKFFDVVTYTGNGGTPQNIAHSLGSVPGCIMVKPVSGSGAWVVYHRSQPSSGGVEYNGVLNETAAWNNLFASSGTDIFRIATFGVTSTNFTIGTQAAGSYAVNANGVEYVAYLFAHNAGGFGLTGTDNVISCGSFTTDGSGNATVNLGYEPQWVLIKASSTSGSWRLMDNMRGMPVTANSSTTTGGRLYPNFSNADDGFPSVIANATGFVTVPGTVGNSETNIYIAIRRGPMKTPTSGTSVFAPIVRTGTGTATEVTGLSFPPDLVTSKRRAGSNSFEFSRLTGALKRLMFSTTDAEQTDTDTLTGFDLMNGIRVGSDSVGCINYNYGANDWSNYFFRRAPGFMDVVCYTGTGSARTVAHNLTVAPELMIIKARIAGGYDWMVYQKDLGNTLLLKLNETGTGTNRAAFLNSTTPTASVFTVGTDDLTNVSGGTFVSYLFASCPGVSKVGSYTGTGTTQQINCGFTAGARFVLIKRTDSTGDWYVWDSARGIVAGNDPYLLLNSTAAEVTTTDYVDTFSSGFEISSTAPAAINASGGTFIYLAIA